MRDETARDKRVRFLADLPGAGRGALNAIATGVDPETGDSGPADLIVGRPRPQSALAVDHDGRRYVEGGVLVEPGTAGRYQGQARPIAATGRSSWVTQIPQRVAGGGAQTGSRALLGPRGEALVPLEQPEDAAPWSHLLRVVDGHLCLVLYDPIEHSAADRADLAGGGFLASQAGDVRVRTRLGDVLGVMVPGEPSSPEFAPPPEPGGGDTETAAREALAGSEESQHSGYTGARDSAGDDEAVGEGQRKSAAERQRTLDEIDRIIQNPNSSQRQVEAARLARRRLEDGRVESFGGWMLLDEQLGLYQGPDGRLYQIDLANGRMVAQRADRRRDDPSDPGRITVGLPGAPRPGNPNLIQVGLGRRPRGAQVLRPATAEQTAALDQQIADLEQRRRTSGLTTAEQAQLNDLRRQRAGQTTIMLGLGLGGGSAPLTGTDRNGNPVLFVGLAQGSRTLGAPVSGISSRSGSPQVAAASETARREAVDRIIRQIHDVRAQLERLGVDINVAGGVVVGSASPPAPGRSR